MSYKSIVLALVALLAAFAVYLYNQPNLGECPEPTWEELYPSSYDSQAYWLLQDIEIVNLYIRVGKKPPAKFEGIPCSFDMDWQVKHPACQAWNKQ